MEWTNDVLIDNQVYVHSPVVDAHRIAIRRAGDYLLTYNNAFLGFDGRVDPQISVEVNGLTVPGAGVRSHYIRKNNGHDESSGSLVFYLHDLSFADVLTVRTEVGSAAGTVTALEDALLILEQKTDHGGERIIPSVTNVTASSADLLVDVDFTHSAWELTWFWGTNSGGTDPGAWELSASAGCHTDVVTRISTPAGLSPNTAYHAALLASNCATQVWTTIPVFHSLELGPEVVTAGLGAGTGPGRADLYWNLITDSSADITMYWGASDGGTNAGAWDHEIPAGSFSNGIDSATVSGLLFGVQYYYRVFASNSFGTGWSEHTELVKSTDHAEPMGPSAWLTSTQRSDGAVVLNADDSLVSLDWTGGSVNDDYFIRTNGHELVVRQPGDYFVAFTLPMTNSNRSVKEQRTCIRAELYLDGVGQGTLGAIG
ncbi:MAG: hypothetical protein AAF492_25520, partial [Verrucomicrobiota bacterium]